MPRSAFQKAVFGTMMALVMVYGMEVYNSSLNSGGLSRSCFLISISEILLLCVSVILLETMIGGPLARRLAFRFVDARNDKPIKVILAVSIATVCCMCPMMSLVGVILFKGLDGRVIAKWGQTVALNFPMALCWQVLIAGPLVRMLFGRLFSAQLQQAKHP